MDRTSNDSDNFLGVKSVFCVIFYLTKKKICFLNQLNFWSIQSIVKILYCDKDIWYRYQNGKVLCFVPLEFDFFFRRQWRRIFNAVSLSQCVSTCVMFNCFWPQLRRCRRRRHQSFLFFFCAPFVYYTGI